MARKKLLEREVLPPKQPATFWKQLPLLLLVAVVAFILGTRSTEFMARFSPQDQTLALGQLQVIYNEIRSAYDGDLSTEEALNGAKKGLVEATGDPYTTFFTPKEAEEFNNDRNGRYEGIGAELGKRNDNVVVISTMDNSPARAAGLRSGDIIAKINDDESLSWSVEKVVTNIRGKKDTTVKLTVLRDGEAKEFTITRAEITDASVKIEMLEGNIGYIRISRFGDDTSVLAGKKAQELSDQGAEKYILDLRGNGGGLVDAAQSVASLWLENVTVATQKRHDGEKLDAIQAYQNAQLKGKPTIVLIDGGSASASEIVAGALHDHQAARLVGQKSFGKGSVQAAIDTIGGQLKVTVAKWYTPKGKNISKEGITPDVVVEQTADDINAGRDPQRDKAIELLK